MAKRTPPPGSSPLYKAAFAAAQANGMTFKTVTTVKGRIIVPSGSAVEDASRIPSGANATALGVDATSPDEAEVFTIKIVKSKSRGKLEFTLQTQDGRDVTAVDLGAIRSKKKATKLRNAPADGSSGTVLTFEEQDEGTVKISTDDGHYVTATQRDRGGRSKPVPIPTTAKPTPANSQHGKRPIVIVPIACTVTQNGPGKKP